MSDYSIGLARFEELVNKAYETGQCRPAVGQYRVHQPGRQDLCCAMGAARLLTDGYRSDKLTRDFIMEEFGLSCECVDGIILGFDGDLSVRVEDEFVAGYMTGERLRSKWVEV